MLNLRLNYPSIEQESDIFQQFVTTLPQQERLSMLQPGPFAPDAATCSLLNNFLELPSGTLEQHSDVVHVCSGNNAIHCLLTLFRGVTAAAAGEAFTYNSFIQSGQSLGYDLHALPCDEEGVLPDALRQYLETGKSRLIFLQPTIQNPTCTVMPLQRRQAVAEVIRSFKDVYLIEDDAYRFLHPDPPPTFLSLLPERTIYICSFSKMFNFFVRAVYLIYPKGSLPAEPESVIRFTSSGSSSLFNAFIRYLMQGKQLKEVIAEKRRIAAGLQEKVAPIFKGLHYRTFPNSYHMWIELPEGLTSGAVVSRLQRLNIDLMDGASFSIDGRQDHIRVALGAARQSELLIPSLEAIAREIVKGEK